MAHSGKCVGRHGGKEAKKQGNRWRASGPWRLRSAEVSAFRHHSIRLMTRGRQLISVGGPPWALLAGPPFVWRRASPREVLVPRLDELRILPQTLPCLEFALQHSPSVKLIGEREKVEEGRSEGTKSVANRHGGLSASPTLPSPLQPNVQSNLPDACYCCCCGMASRPCLTTMCRTTVSGTRPLQT